MSRRPDYPSRKESTNQVDSGPTEAGARISESQKNKHKDGHVNRLVQFKHISEAVWNRIKHLSETVWRNSYVMAVPIQVVVSLLSVLVVADRIPLEVVNEGEGTFLSKGPRGGITVGEVSRYIPFELLDKPVLRRAFFGYLFASFLIVGVLYSLGKLGQNYQMKTHTNRWAHIWTPIVFMPLLWVGIAGVPGIEFCNSIGRCQNVQLFVGPQSSMLFLLFGGFQSLIVGVVAWTYKHELIPGTGVDLQQHLDNWWQRVRSVNQFLLVAAVNLSIPFALNQTGIGFWTILWTVFSFGSAVLLIQYFSFRKTREIESKIYKS